MSSSLASPEGRVDAGSIVGFVEAGDMGAISAGASGMSTSRWRFRDSCCVVETSWSCGIASCSGLVAVERPSARDVLAERASADDEGDDAFSGWA